MGVHLGDLNRALRSLAVAMLELDTAEHRALRDLQVGKGELSQFHLISKAHMAAADAFHELKELQVYGDDLAG